MKPFKVVEESETHITYEYRTAYTWILYAALLMTIAGMVMPNDLLMLAGAFLIIVHFVVRLSLGYSVNSKIQRAMKSNVVTIRGNKASFSNPLRIQVPK